VRALTIAVVALLGAAPGATAAPAVTPPQRPLDLPAPGTRSAEAENWIVGAAPGGALLTAIARLHCARDLGVAGAYALPVGRARAFAASLRRAGLLRYAEPDRRQRPLAAAISPAEARRTAWRTASVADGLRPPPVTRSSPLLALVDSAADRTHPEWRRSGSLAVLRGVDVTDVHGTATASVAGAPANGFGVVGLWPGMRLLNVPAATPRGVSCAAAVRGIATALRSGARAINLSFGAPFPCYAQYEAVSLAVARGVLVVAAAGNRRTARPRPVLFPAAFPHVLSVAAYGPSGPGGRYATTGGAVDVAAPGERIAAAVPPALDREQAADGVALVDGTSFSAPIVAAAGAWLLQARPRLRADQVAAALRASARDLGPPGFDAASGHGALDLAAALRAPAPARDAQEVDDDVEWVTGRRHTRPARGGRWRSSASAG